MKKIFLILGVFLTVFVLLSSATAVPQTKSSVFFDSLEEKKASLLEILSIQTLGIIDLIIKIIQWMIDFVLELIDVVDLTGTLVEVIGQLFDAINDLIEMIKDLFNPDESKLFL